MASTVTRRDAADILTGIEGRREAIVSLCRRKPALARLSRERLREEFGETLALFRCVGLLPGEDLRPEAVVSAALDWRVAAIIGAEFPSLRHRPHLLRYEVPVSRAIAYVPFLVGLAEARGGIGGGKRMNMHGIVPEREYVALGKAQTEVVADVSGLRPSVFPFAEARNDPANLLVADMASGAYQSPRQYARHLAATTSNPTVRLDPTTNLWRRETEAEVAGRAEADAARLLAFICPPGPGTAVPAAPAGPRGP